MISRAEEEMILARAYVPEHIVSLMVLISKGEPFLVGGYLCFAGDNWLIVVGYPLASPFSDSGCTKVVEEMTSRFHPEYLWFAGPQVPSCLADGCTERETDCYYTFNAETKPKRALMRTVEKAAGELDVERSQAFTKEHLALVSELLERQQLPPRIRELYRAMPGYVKGSSFAIVLDARDKRGRLSAFYVIDVAARTFDTYLLGFHSRKHYVRHASDLLFFEMIKVAEEHGKPTINLGLGVNPGIRRFKEKWGGVPSLAYEFCERHYPREKVSSLLRLLEGRR